MVTNIWDERGLIPPIDQQNPTSNNRSPYKITIFDFIDIFGFSQKRLELLDSFLDFQKKLLDSGLLIHKQWINGSFCEHCEITRNRSPNDIDAVFFYTVNNEELYKININCLSNELVKKTFKVDSYLIYLPTGDTNIDTYCNFMNITAYWSSLWSHTRSGQWKGFIELDNFNIDNYNNAKLLITNKRSEING